MEEHRKGSGLRQQLLTFCASYLWRGSSRVREPICARQSLGSFHMSNTGVGTAIMSQETNTKLRSLAHDLSNSIETIMQASYLLAQSNLDDTSKKWLELIDNATREAARINREIREILRSQSAAAPTT
jgi:hypothetical protein